MSRRLGALASAYVGRRIELAPHREEWARGARYGTITRVTARGFTVKLDRMSRTIHGITDDDITEYLD